MLVSRKQPQLQQKAREILALSTTLFDFRAEISENIKTDTTQHDSLNWNNLICRNKIKQIWHKWEVAETDFTVKF